MDGESRMIPRANMGDFHHTKGCYHYVGLRRQDIEPLRRWRNTQMEVLRQNAPISPEAQERWYRTTVVAHHDSREPAMLLVSILDADGSFLGYGGLTNIDWTHLRAEVSFLVDPVRASNGLLYQEDFSAFLGFLQRWAFRDLGLNRIFTETYAFRRDHIKILEAAGLKLEGRLRQHTVDPDDSSRFVDSILHGMTAGQIQEEPP